MDVTRRSTATAVALKLRQETPVVEMRGVTRRFVTVRRSGWWRRRAATEPVLALDGVSLALFPGEVLALLGPSGCGKSTTLRVIAGFERPDEGEVLVSGQPVATGVLAPHPKWQPPERRTLGMVFQDYALFPHHTVTENVAYGLRRASPAARRQRTEELLSLVGLIDFASRYPHQLSGGQQQRVALARALAPFPRAILLDEAFNTLDAGLRDQIRNDLLGILRAQGTAVLMVTHDQAEALSCADRVAVMRAGRIEQIDAPAALYNRPATRFAAGFVGEGSFLPVRIAAGTLYTPLGAVTLPEAIAHVPSGPAQLLVRPGEATIEPGGPTIVSNAIVLARRERGPDADYDLLLRPAPEFSADDVTTAQETRSPLHVHADTWIPAGQPVQVKLHLRHLVLFRGEHALTALCTTRQCGCRVPLSASDGVNEGRTMPDAGYEKQAMALSVA
jgi:iron(III) transport system ATP-binding protein